jgi:hypothetical protein
MNEKDLRDCFAMFALAGLVMREGVVEKSALEFDAWSMADRMLEARNMETGEGIVAIKKRVRKPK